MSGDGDRPLHAEDGLTVLGELNGTPEVMPFPKPFMRPGLVHRAGTVSTTSFGSTFGKNIVEISSNAWRMLTKTNDCTKELEMASGDCPYRILQARNAAIKVVMVGPPSR